MRIDLTKVTPEMKALLKRCADGSPEVARAARYELAIALTTPIKKGILDGSNITGIFETMDFDAEQATDYPLDFITPGTEDEYLAYTIPMTGRLPEFHVSGDYLNVHTYEVGATIDTRLSYIKRARWDVVNRMIQALEGMVIHKDNVDAWWVLISAAKGRNLIPYDDAAAAGLFTHRVLTLASTVMMRNAGGNSSSQGRGELTDVFMSPEAHADIFSWDLSQVSDEIRTRIFLSQTGDGLSKIGKVTLHEMTELGVGQAYQDYYENVLGGTLPSDKTEIMVGLDLKNKDSFVNPIREPWRMYEDMTFHRSGRMSLYGRKEGGWGCLDARRTLVLAI